MVDQNKPYYIDIADTDRRSLKHVDLALKSKYYSSLIIDRCSIQPRSSNSYDLTENGNNAQRRRWFLVVQRSFNMVRVVVFLAAISMAMLQTYELMNGYVHQTTISKIVPVQNLTLRRPQLVVCANIFQLFLSRSYSKLTSDEVTFVSTLALDYSTQLYDDLTHIFNLSDKDFPFVAKEISLRNVAQQFTPCSKVLRHCNSLELGRSTTLNCCEKAYMFFSPGSLCYTIPNYSFQRRPGKENSATYELLFPTVDYGVTYNVYLAHHDDFSNTNDLPITIVEKGLEINIEIEMKTNTRLNTTSRKCTKVDHLSLPFCATAMRSKVIKELCHCDVAKPIWSFNISSFGSDVFLPGTNINNNSSRPCRLLEAELCAMRQEADYRRLLRSLILDCYASKCRTSSYPDKIVRSKLPVYSRRYSGKPTNDSHRSSLVYVFYKTFTISKVYEMYGTTWSTLLSSLGGIWGLWLGWSLFQAINVILTITSKILNQ